MDIDAGNYVVIGGGNASSRIAGGLAIRRNAISHATIVVAATDNDPESSTARLGMLFVGDLVRVWGRLHWTLYNSDGFLELLASRLKSGIPKGKRFGDLFGDLIGGGFSRAMKGSRRERRQTIDSICSLLNIDNIKDEIPFNLLLDAFDHRLEGDDFTRHSFRNVFFQTLCKCAEKRGEGFEAALDAMHVAYNIPKNFRAEPVSEQYGVLRARTMRGREVVGQYKIDNPKLDPEFSASDPCQEFWIEPPISATSRVVRAIKAVNAGLILSSGSYGGSMRAPLAVDGVCSAIQSLPESTPIVCVMNLMQREGEPSRAEDLIEQLQFAIGRPLTCVIYDRLEHLKDKLGDVPESPIDTRGLNEYARSRRFDDPPFRLVEGELAKISLHNLNRPDDRVTTPEVVHDEGRLAEVFAAVFPDVLAGAR